MTVGRSEEENLPSFSDPEDYDENLTDNGKDDRQLIYMMNIQVDLCRLFELSFTKLIFKNSVYILVHSVYSQIHNFLIR